MLCAASLIYFNIMITSTVPTASERVSGAFQNNTDKFNLILYPVLRYGAQWHVTKNSKLKVSSVD